MAQAPQPLVAALADRYRIERELGAGGMATVYLAEDLKHDRKVAIKVLKPELAAKLGADRFLTEIRVTAQLQHPNILPLFDSGIVESQEVSFPASHPRRATPYYVMPYVEGETLRAELDRNGRLAIDRAIRIATEVANALGYAHQRGIIHRDVKPENILLASGVAVVADFGIARAVRAAGDERLTQTGIALGTPTYMSPEQAAGESDVDGRSDIYSLGAVLYEMLTGEPPFTGATPEAILVQRFTSRPPSVRLKRPDVSSSLDSAIRRAMSRDPDNRFGTAEAFATALSSPTRHEDGQSHRSIAVLPFTNMSGDPDNEYFSDGITEEIISALTQLPGLRVAARTSSFSFKGRNADLRTIGDQLSVETILEGSVRRSDGRIRVTAQLTSVEDGYHLWSERYDRDLTDVFAIQDEIATVIASRLRVTLGDGGVRLVRPPTANLDAYDLYLRGHALLKQRGPALLQAVRFFEEATAADPALALGHAELSETLALMALYGMIPASDIADRARQASRRALELEPRLVLGHLVQGLNALMIDFDRESSSAALARAVTLDPRDLEARTLQAVFDFCYVRGDGEATREALRSVVDQDPRNANARAQLALALGWTRHYAEAVTEARRAIELDPNAFYPQWSLIHALALGDNPAEAIAVGQPALARFGRHPWLMMGLSLANGALDRRDTAAALSAELVARSKSEYVQPTALAAAAIGAGDIPAAISYVQQAADVRDPLFAVALAHWPVFDVLRASDGFRRAVLSLGWGPAGM